jgi:hypothetical protein
LIKKSKGIMRVLLFFLYFISPALAIYQGETEKNHAGFSRYIVHAIGVDKNVSCSGILVAPDIIATVAWCGMGLQRMRWLYHTQTGEKITLLPIHGLIHPDFDPSKTAWGIANLALIRLAKPVGDNLGELYKTIPQNTVALGETVTITGFGRSEHENTASAGVFRHARAYVLMPLHYFFRIEQVLNPPVTDNTKPIPSACAGDWGGGVFQKKEGKDILMGMIVGNIPPKDTLRGSCGGQTTIIHLGLPSGWMELSIEELRKRAIPK